MRSFEMLSFANTRLSFYLFLLCLASLAASTPITYHRHHPDSRPFPYGKLADKLLNVNDISYMMDDDFDADMFRVYPESQSIPFSSALPITSFELPLRIKTTIPNVDSKSLFSFVYRIADIIKKIFIPEWDSALPVVWLCTMARAQ